MMLRIIFLGGPFGSTKHTWRIIPFSKWLVTPIYKPFRPFGMGIYLADLLSMVINHLPSGMILQVPSRKNQRMTGWKIHHE